MFSFECMIKDNLFYFCNLSDNTEFPKIAELLNIEIVEEDMSMKLAENAILNILCLALLLALLNANLKFEG